MPQDEITTEQPKGALAELAQIRAEARAQASKKPNDDGDDLPQGAAPVAAEVAQVAEPEAPAPAAEAAAEPASSDIHIGDKVFKTQAEAIRYAESLEHDKEVGAAYHEGIREAREALTPPPPPEEDNFEERFYSNPKQALADVRQQATEDALKTIRAESYREQLWQQFCGEYPDLAGSRTLIESILNTNPEIGQIKDLNKGFKVLATRARSHYQDYIDRAKPRTEMKSAGARVVSPGSGSAPASVTLNKKAEAPLTMAQQLRTLRK